MPCDWGVKARYQILYFTSSSSAASAAAAAAQTLTTDGEFQFGH